jgi:hypothetical protein
MTDIPNMLYFVFVEILFNLLYSLGLHPNPTNTSQFDQNPSKKQLIEGIKGFVSGCPLFGNTFLFDEKHFFLPCTQL